MKKNLTLKEQPIQDEATLLISQAIAKGTDVETMEKLLAMRKELKAEKAKEAYDQAMASFQGECPIIERVKQGYNYKYAPIEVIAEQIKPILFKNGLSYTFNTEEIENKIIVYCTVTHIAGHTGEPSKAVITKENTTKMNSSQQSGAVMTYGKRYSLMNALAIMVRDEDTDASIGDNIPERQVRQDVVQPVATAIPSITDKQKQLIQVQLKRANKTMDWLVAGLKMRYKINDYHNLSIQQASEVISGLLNMRSDVAEDVPEVDVTDSDMDQIEQQEIK